MKNPALKKKVLQIALLLLVLAIWGIAGYRYLKNGEEPFIEIAQPVKRKTEALRHANDYTLMLNYRDPFLNEVAAPADDEEMMEEQPAEAAPPPPPPPPVVWPQLDYHGVLKSGKNQSGIALITANGRQHLLQNGELFEGIRIVKLYPDSARFSYSGEMKTFLAK